MTADLIINVCLTGMIPTRETSPHVPLTPEEIVRDALAVRACGARIVHVHARDARGAPTWDPGAYREIFTELRRQAPDLILCATTSGRTWSEREKRAAVLTLEDPVTPDMASLTLGSMNFPRTASVNPPDVIEYLLAAMNERGIRPELEVFDLGMIDVARRLLDRGRLSPPLYFNLLLGNAGTAAATPFNLAVMVERLPAGATWAAAGIGRHQFPMNALALAMGGHVRVGIEDNLHLDATTRTPATNTQLVERLLGVAAALGRAPRPAAEVRRLLGLRVTERV